MKRIIFILMVFISLFPGCTKENEEIQNSDAEKLLINLKEKFGIEYEKVDVVNDSSIIVSLEELEAFFIDFEKQSDQCMSRIAEPDLLFAQSIEEIGIGTRSIDMVDVMGRYRINGHCIDYNFKFELPNPLFLSVTYMKFDTNSCSIYDRDIVQSGKKVMFYAYAYVNFLTTDALGHGFRVNWAFHISGSIDNMDQGRSFTFRTYLSKEDYSEKKVD